VQLQHNIIPYEMRCELPHGESWIESISSLHTALHLWWS